MTDCPRHPRAVVEHKGIQIGWRGTVWVMHRCPGIPGTAHRAHRWNEKARDEAAVLAKVGLQRIPSADTPRGKVAA